MTAFLISFITAAILGYLVIRLYRSRGWLDYPQQQLADKTVHTAPLPRGGGVVIFGALLVGGLALLKLDSYIVAIGAGALLLTVVGWLDDLWNIHPKWRLLAGTMAGLMVVASGVGVAYISNPFGGQVIHLNWPLLSLQLVGHQFSIWVLADFLALLFIVWNMNSVNWSKGVDGQLSALMIPSFIFVGLLSQRFTDDPTNFGTTTLSFLCAGAFAGLAVWNWYPQKMLPGYGAGSLAGFMMAVLAILSGAKVATVLMVLAIPTADALYTIIRRIRSGHSPIWGDRGHLHHILLDVYHWPIPLISLFYALTSILLGMISLQLNTWGKIATMMLVTGAVFVIHSQARRQQGQQHTTKAS